MMETDKIMIVKPFRKKTGLTFTMFEAGLSDKLEYIYRPKSCFVRFGR